MKKTITFIYAIVALAVLTLPPAHAAAVDFSPVLEPILQALGIVAGVVALPLMWYVVNWLRGLVGLQAIQKDAAIRVALDAGLQKSVGSGISRVQAAVAGLPMTVDTKNEVIQVAAEYAKNTINDTLKAANLDDPTKLAAAIESRLGVMEMQTSTGQASPAIPNAAQPLAPAVKA